MDTLDWINYFMSHVQVSDSCWFWTGSRWTHGYAVARFNKKRVRAHRLSYALFKGPPGKNLVCHTCDIKHCVYPDHLWLGTNDENNKDKKAKGRARNQFTAALRPLTEKGDK